MAEDAVDLTFLAEQSRRILDELRDLRREVSGLTTLARSEFDYVRRIERRQSELKDDLELVLKMELGGALANLETKLDDPFARIEEMQRELDRRVHELETSDRS